MTENAKPAKKLYQCKVCGLHYESKELAKRCDEFCREHHACGLDIIKHSVEEKQRLAENK